MLEEKISILKECTIKEKESNRIKELEHEEVRKQSEALDKSILQLEQNHVRLNEALIASKRVEDEQDQLVHEELFGAVDKLKQDNQQLKT